MEKEFVPYELVLKLKEIGFDEPCLAMYIKNGLTNKIILGYKQPPFTNNENGNAPLFQQVFRWIREKYKLQHEISSLNSCLISYLDIEETLNWEGNLIVSHKHIHLDDEEGYEIEFNSYEEAELACLNKLIEIVQNEYQGNNN